MIKRLLNFSVLGETLQRFPICLIFAILTFVISIVEINDLFNMPKDIVGRLLFFSVLGFFYACSVRIIWDGGRIDQKFYKSTLIIGLILYGFLVLLLSEDSRNTWLMLTHVTVANFTVLFFAPYIGTRNANFSLWEYNRQLWLGVGIALLASIIFWAGFSGALASIGYLFNIKINADIYASLWAFAAILLAPLYALSNIPKRFDFDQKDCQLNKPLLFLIQWILLPLVAFYFLILYVYFGKMLVLWEMPKGQLAYMIMGFASAGILTFLISWPYQSVDQKLFKLFKKYFFLLLILPSIILAFAVFIRIDHYGITMQRFYLVTITVYLILISLMMSFKSKDLRLIFIVPLILFLLTSTPLFNARDASINSQERILNDLLNANNMMRNGKIIPTNDSASITPQDQMRMTEQFYYLNRLYTNDQKNEAWGTEKTITHNNGGFEKLFGFEPLRKYKFEMVERQLEKKEFSYQLSHSKMREVQIVDVRNYDFISTEIIRLHQSRNPYSISPWRERGVEMQLRGNIISVIFSPDHSMIKTPVSFGLSDVLNEILSEYPKMPVMNKPIIMTKSNGFYNVKIIINNLVGKIDGGKPSLENANFYLMYGRIK
jgi:hypothetical protein